MATDIPTKEQLVSMHCWENVDQVGRDPETTAFKRRARMQQSLWREQNGLPIGTQPTRPKPGKPGRPIGSRIEVDHAHAMACNFLSEAARHAVRTRVSTPEPHQTLNADRLYADLLSSMPMCFNLFGPVSIDLATATCAVATWWPEAPGSVNAVRFEWSPGRRMPGRFLENASAFDVAFELALDDGQRGIIGVETKYHEHCIAEKPPSEDRRRRYRMITAESGVFVANAADTIEGTPLQQIWLDHLLALSMLQDPSENWTWAKFVLVYPERNPSFARAANEYRALLTEPGTFEARTIESLLDGPAIGREDGEAFRGRYLW